MEGETKDDSGDRRDQRNDEQQHDRDKPGGATLILLRRLGDAEDVDKRIGKKEQRAHGSWMINGEGGSGFFCIR
jgi:hypothetical protein